MVRQTSIKTYYELIEEGYLGKNEKIVYGILQEMGSATDAEMASYMSQSDPNKIRPRRNHLMQIGLVQEKERRPCRVTKRTAIVWQLTPNPDYNKVAEKILSTKKRKFKCPCCNGKGYISGQTRLNQYDRCNLQA